MTSNPTPDPDPDDPGTFGTDPHLDHEPQIVLDPDDPGPFALEDTAGDIAQPGEQHNDA
jgi:hypothetical protein